MVKQAEKIRKRNPWQPVFGLVIAIGLLIVAFALEDPLAELIRRYIPNATFSLPVATSHFDVTRALVAFMIWLVLMAFAFALVAILAGKDPNSAKDIQLPPRTKEEKDRRY